MSAIVASFYIPRMNANITKNRVIEAFYNVGQVSRVDFTTINKKPGFGENIDRVVKSAFVHFTSLTQYGYVIKFEIEKNNSFKFYPHDLYSHYWILLHNKNPIQDTLMNNAQIVENCRYLEEKIQKQDQTIHDLQDKVNNLQFVINELLAHLYNREPSSEEENEHEDEDDEIERNGEEPDQKMKHLSINDEDDEIERNIEEELEQRMQNLSYDYDDYAYDYDYDDMSL